MHFETGYSTPINSLIYRGFPGGSDGKESAGNARDPGLIPGLRRSPGGGHGNPLQFLSGISHGQRSLAGYSPWSLKELDKTEQLTLSLSFLKILFIYLFHLFLLVGG